MDYRTFVYSKQMLFDRICPLCLLLNPLLHQQLLDLYLIRIVFMFPSENQLTIRITKLFSGHTKGIKMTLVDASLGLDRLYQGNVSGWSGVSIMWLCWVSLLVSSACMTLQWRDKFALPLEDSMAEKIPTV